MLWKFNKQIVTLHVSKKIGVTPVKNTKRIYIKDLKLEEFKKLVCSINKADKTDFNNKYDEIFKNKNRRNTK